MWYLLDGRMYPERRRGAIYWFFRTPVDNMTWKQKVVLGLGLTVAAGLGYVALVLAMCL